MLASMMVAPISLSSDGERVFTFARVPTGINTGVNVKNL